MAVRAASDQASRSQDGSVAKVRRLGLRKGAAANRSTQAEAIIRVRNGTRTVAGVSDLYQLHGRIPPHSRVKQIRRRLQIPESRFRAIVLQQRDVFVNRLPVHWWNRRVILIEKRRMRGRLAVVRAPHQ